MALGNTGSPAQLQVLQSIFGHGGGIPANWGVNPGGPAQTGTANPGGQVNGVGLGRIAEAGQPQPGGPPTGLQQLIQTLGGKGLSPSQSTTVTPIGGQPNQPVEGAPWGTIGNPGGQPIVPTGGGPGGQPMTPSGGGPQGQPMAPGIPPPSFLADLEKIMEQLGIQGF